MVGRAAHTTDALYFREHSHAPVLLIVLMLLQYLEWLIESALVRRDWLGSFHIVHVANVVDEPAVFRAYNSLVLWRQELMRKADLEAVRVIDHVHLVFIKS